MRKTLLFALAQTVTFAVWAQDDGDLTIINKIKEEGQQHSKVMDIAFHLTDVSGPRLTASPNFMNAANWARTQLTSWGLTNATIEPWGEFGRGWQQERCYIAMTKPYYQAFIAIPRAWTGSTPGKKIMNSAVVLIKAKDSADLMQYAGKLKDRIVMTWVDATLTPGFTADARRYEDSTLDKMAKAEARPAQPRNANANGPRPQANNAFAFQRILSNFLMQEKPALILGMNARG